MGDAALLALAEQVEALTGSDREVDALIAVAACSDPGAWVVTQSTASIFSHQPGWFCTSADLSVKAPAYTASIDAAMTLVPEGYNRWAVTGRNSATCGPAEGSAKCEWHFAATPAIALVVACLRARASQ